MVDLVSVAVELDDLVESVELLVAFGDVQSGVNSWRTEECCRSCRVKGTALQKSHASLFFAAVNAVAYGDGSAFVATFVIFPSVIVAGSAACPFVITG